MKPLAVDLYCGLGGWSSGFLAEGYDVIGFDIEARPYPGQLVLQDVLTIHGRQFKDAAIIVASPPCTEYSYMAMPWKRAKRIALAIRDNSRITGPRSADFPDDYSGSRNTVRLNALFDACFCIQREASEAAGRYIPLVVENVKGAQPWVGRARANFGSFYLWGDVESIGGAIVAGGVRFGNTLRAAGHRKTVPGSWDLTRDNYNPDHAWGTGLKLPGNNTPRLWCDREVQRLCDAPVHSRALPGSADSQAEGLKRPGLRISAGFNNWPKDESGAYILPDGSRVGGTGVKQQGLSGPAWFDQGAAHHSSRSAARKAASAQIAKIPFDLARHIARVFKPQIAAIAPRLPTPRQVAEGHSHRPGD